MTAQTRIQINFDGSILIDYIGDSSCYIVDRIIVIKNTEYKIVNIKIILKYVHMTMSYESILVVEVV